MVVTEAIHESFKFVWQLAVYIAVCIRHQKYQRLVKKRRSICVPLDPKRSKDCRKIKNILQFDAFFCLRTVHNSLMYLPQLF